MVAFVLSHYDRHTKKVPNPYTFAPGPSEAPISFEHEEHVLTLEPVPVLIVSFIMAFTQS